LPLTLLDIVPPDSPSAAPEPLQAASDTANATKAQAAAPARTRAWM
jgi:hypothetical protein